MTKLIEMLKESWEDGFFYDLRMGQFDQQTYEKLKFQFEELSDEELQTGEPNKQLISLVWFIPLFIEWQKERLVENGVDPRTVDEIASYFFGQCQRILGFPE